MNAPAQPAWTTRRDIPRHILVVLFGLIAFTLIASGLSYHTGIGRTGEPSIPTLSRMLTFDKRADNTLAVIDANTGQTIEVLPSADEGFLPGAIRSLRYERRRLGKPDDAPFRLVGEASRGLALIDPATGIYLQLEAYGFENARQVARLLQASNPSLINTAAN